MEQVEVNHVALPEWTEYRKKNGLDPLGMQNSSVSLYQTFLPGISNVTLRMRYYGLYPWLAHRYAREIGDTNPESWKRIVRRAEALYALIAAANGGETGVAGTEWALRTLEVTHGDTIEFASATEPGSETYYLKQAWGAFGAAYRSQLFEIGAFDPTEFGEIPLPKRPLGQELANGFQNSLDSVADKFFETLQRGHVQRGELTKFAPVLPSAIAPDSKERSIYESVLLSDASDPKPGDLSRKLSIQLILKITELLEREPRADEIRWVLYAGQDQLGTPLVLDDGGLQAQRARWWVYHANDLCHIAFEALLKFSLDTLSEHPAGLSLARLIGDCAEAILSEFEQRPTSLAALIESTKATENAFNPDDAGSEFSLARNIIRAGRSDASVCTPETAADAIRLLAILHQRIDDTGADLNESFGGFNPDAFRSLLSEKRFLDRYRDEDFQQIVERLFEERIVRRHLWVALRKLRHQGDYTFLIENDDGKLRLREKDGPVFTNPRLGPAITFLKDIGLLGENGLTAKGREAVGV